VDKYPGFAVPNQYLIYQHDGTKVDPGNPNPYDVTENATAHISVSEPDGAQRFATSNTPNLHFWEDHEDDGLTDHWKNGGKFRKWFADEVCNSTGCTGGH